MFAPAGEAINYMYMNPTITKWTIGHGSTNHFMKESTIFYHIPYFT